MTITIYHISDTHLRPWDDKVEDADLLIHSGDALNYGSLAEVQHFAQELKLVHKRFTQILFVPGNHDWAFDGPHRDVAIQMLQSQIPNLKVLIHEPFEFQNKKFFGTPYQPEFCSWAFNKEDEELEVLYSEIPEDTEFLITHNPPLQILDRTVNRHHPQGYDCGSRVLSDRLLKLPKLKANFFGHIHWSNGTLLREGIHYSNASICDEQYRPLNKAQFVELE